MQETCLGPGFERRHFVQKPRQRGPRSPAWDKNLARFKKRPSPDRMPISLLVTGCRKACHLRSRCSGLETFSMQGLGEATETSYLWIHESPPLRDQIKRPARPESVALPELLKAKVVVVDDVLAVEQMRTGMHLGHFGNLSVDSFVNMPQFCFNSWRRLFCYFVQGLATFWCTSL